jgi:hypothetical protein
MSNMPIGNIDINAISTTVGSAVGGITAGIQEGVKNINFDDTGIYYYFIVYYPFFL